MAQRIFISYARKDDYLSPVSLEEEHTYHHDPLRSFTRQLYNALQAAGFDVWWDREKMPNRGLTFLEEIRKAVHTSDKMVYVSGEHANNSDYVKAEWQYAISQCKPVIPVIRNGDFTLIPPTISMGHAPDMRDMRYFNEQAADLIRLLQDEPAPLATLYSVPNLPEWYIERGSDVADLQASIRADALKPIVVTSKQQTVTLQGMGGLGKTTLASALCKKCETRASFPDGVFWLEIGKTPSIATRQGDIGVAFGDLRDEYPDDKRGKSRLSDLLRERAVLIVLDDVWDHQHVQAFRVDSPASRVLVTTRNGTMATLLGVTQHAIDTLTEAEGMALMGKRLERPADALNPYAEQEREIVRLLGGHTLAISIAAAQIAQEGADYTPRYLQRLRDRLAQGNPLGELKMDENDKNYNLELSLAESYAELQSDLARHFRALGAFAIEGTFDLPALQAVWEISDEYDAEDACKALVKLALLNKAPEGRYSLHGLLRDYARALAEQHGEWDSICQRHFDHYHALHSDYDANQTFAEDGSMLRHAMLSADWENIQVALAWGFAHQAERAVDWVWALQAFMMMRHTTQERQALLKQTLQVAEANQYPQGLANTLQALGDLSVRLAELEQARSYYDRAVKLYEDIGDRLGLANTLMSVGDMLIGQKKWQDAVEVYDKALVLARAIQDRLGIANILVDRGQAVFELGRHEEGMANLQEAVQLFKAVQNPRWAQIAQQRLDAMRRRVGGASDKSEDDSESGISEEALRALVSIYRQLGEAGLRAVLQQNDLPEQAIDLLVMMIQAAADASDDAPDTPENDASATLPAELVQNWSKNTVAVMTGVPEKREEWRENVQGIRANVAGQGDDWTNELVFVDALLAILDGQPVSIADENPYSNVIQQVQEAIAGYKKDF